MGNAVTNSISPARPSPAELRRMPAEQRDAILEAQAAEAEALYRHDPDLSGFDAVGEDDGDGDASAAAAR